MKYGTCDLGQFMEEQKKSFRWRYMKQDDEETQRSMKIELLAGAYTCKVVENDP